MYGRYAVSIERVNVLKCVDQQNLFIRILVHRDQQVLIGELLDSYLACQSTSMIYVCFYLLKVKFIVTCRTKQS